MSSICPYNSSHKIGKKRFEIHKMTCPNRPVESQILIKPMVSNDIQDIRVAYLRDHGGIQPPKVINDEYSNGKKMKKKKRRDIVAQLNEIQMISGESIESKNYSDLLGKELDMISVSSLKIEGMGLKNPMSVNSPYSNMDHWNNESNQDNDVYDPNREDYFISKRNKNDIPVELISKYMYDNDNDKKAEISEDNKDIISSF